MGGFPELLQTGHPFGIGADGARHAGEKADTRVKMSSSMSLLMTTFEKGLIINILKNCIARVILRNHVVGNKPVSNGDPLPVRNWAISGVG